MSLFQMTTPGTASVSPNSALAEVIRTRANIFEMTEAAEKAVLCPKDTGSLPHDLRASIAARIAAKAGDTTLAARYLEKANALALVSDPAKDGGADHALIVQFVDKAANATKDIVSTDIADLQAAGVSDADIVRLCELVAFVAYQLRVVAGLRLLHGQTA
ncbi:hypothetical protein [Marivita sp. XM-24bin2]|uniref:hypothetical protein n=1 Tax=Marivita sp. XM-24bin2 TaxID=2133951 RepID=UPI000D78E8EB|nr:hypothetical protein [Marivita sp. XM-24bin2]PWL33487.1 MAG: hypothetical protein DCO97_19425 [Marivita sp. XM-24bin2]